MVVKGGGGGGLLQYCYINIHRCINIHKWTYTYIHIYIYIQKHTYTYIYLYYCADLVPKTYLELSTVCNAFEVLLLKKGWSKWICNASASLNVGSWLCWESIEKLLRFTDVGDCMLKSGCVWIVLCPMHESVCFLILLCSTPPIEPIVVDDSPAWRKLRVIRQRDVDPMYDNSHLSHTYL